MKMKNDVVVIIILLIICFVVIPLISQFFVKDLLKEGYRDEYPLNTIEVNRVLKEVKGPDDVVHFNTEAITKDRRVTNFTDLNKFLSQSKEDRPGQDISYNFCIGKLTCDPGHEMKKLSLKDNDNTNLYYPYCVSGNSFKDIKCEGGIKNMTKEGDAFDGSGFTPNFSFNRYQISENPFYFTQYELNADKTGRKKVKDLLECDYVADSKLKVACSKREADNRDVTQNSGGVNGVNAEYMNELFQTLMRSANDNSRSNNTTTTSTDPIKCIADFGTKIGDSLCCGQTGVLQDTKYTCPNTMPYCSDFKCGSKFGTCRK
jgi:hypothetical protein